MSPKGPVVVLSFLVISATIEEASSPFSSSGVEEPWGFGSVLLTALKKSYCVLPVSLVATGEDYKK
jgi:hypothetical protein